jgi:Kef-type K+ transport system membrane component KefB
MAPQHPPILHGDHSPFCTGAPAGRVAFGSRLPEHPFHCRALPRGGFACGSGGLGIIALDPDTPAVRILADLALFSILFTDGMRVDLAELRASWRPPGRALLLGLPLTLLGTALAGHVIAGLPWIEALLVGAV